MSHVARDRGREEALVQGQSLLSNRNRTKLYLALLVMVHSGFEIGKMNTLTPHLKQVVLRNLIMRGWECGTISNNYGLGNDEKEWGNISCAQTGSTYYMHATSKQRRPPQDTECLATSALNIEYSSGVYNEYIFC